MWVLKDEGLVLLTSVFQDTGIKQSFLFLALGPYCQPTKVNGKTSVGYLGVFLKRQISIATELPLVRGYSDG